MGGTNDPENIKSLSIGEHAEAHRLLYEEHGKIEDRLAWMGLSGMIGREEIIKELMTENGKKVGKRMLEERMGIFKDGIRDEQFFKDGISLGGKITGKKHSESGHCKRVAPLGGGKNLGKKYWFNTLTGKETVSFDSPGEDWVEGVNMARVNLEWLRSNSDNVKGTFWVTDNETGDTRMIHAGEPIPIGFSKGRKLNTRSIVDLFNSPSSYPIDGILQVENAYSLIIFNPSSMRWELIPKKNSKRIVKVSHTDYYGLVWLRDIIIEKYSLTHKKSAFDFSTSDNLEDSVNLLREWREYIKINKILETKKLKKWRREDYNSKLRSLNEGYSFMESIRNKIIKSL
jgi:hypothetical protein